jgi:hypothetical protein
MNLGNIDFGIVLNEVMTIADEVDWQLGQAMLSYAEAGHQAQPV